MKTPLLAAAIAIAAPLCAQSQASLSSISPPCPSGTGAPNLTTTLLPRIGSTFGVTFHNQTCPFGQGCFLGIPLVFVGFQQTSTGLSVPGVSLVGSCTIGVSQDILFRYSFTGPEWSTMPIPNQPSLIGVQFFVQGARVDSYPTGNAIVLLTNVLAGTVGT